MSGKALCYSFNNHGQTCCEPRDFPRFTEPSEVARDHGVLQNAIRVYFKMRSESNRREEKQASLLIEVTRGK